MPDREFPRRKFLGGLALAPAAAAQAAAPAKMKLAVGSDHAGFPMKAPVIEALKSWGYTVTDCGTHSTDPVDFPDIAQKVCAEVLAGRAQRAVMVCGTGVGAAVAANKIPGIRAALCHDTYCAHQAVEHDDVNVLCMGAWVIGPKLAEEVMTAYLNARFDTSDPALRRRLDKVAAMEKR
jgi:ribose 5-phosphate isomerase B